VYIRRKVVGPFPGPAQEGAMCTRLPRVDALFYVIVLITTFMIRDCFKLNTNFGVLIVNYCCDPFFLERL
jgi:hypothetical protein